MLWKRQATRKSAHSWRRVLHCEDASERRSDLHLALDSYPYDFARSLNPVLRGDHCHGISVTLAMVCGDHAVRARSSCPQYG